MSEPIRDYADVRKIIGQDASHLLLGNGFSIACDPIFQYGSLYQRAVKRGLSKRAQEIFAGLGTNNFEGVMHLLDNAHWVAGIYGLLKDDSSDMLSDLEVVKKALVEAIAESHLEHIGQVSEEKRAAACAFFEPYKNVFTTNYDLLTYWVVMSRQGGPRFVDGFAEDQDDPDSKTVVYSFRTGDQPGVFNLHGGLHLFSNAGVATKHCWSRSGQPLTTLVRAGLVDGQYPLFVAEGTSEKKLEQIHRSSYLSYCLEKFGRVQKHLVVFGCSLGDTDNHIRQAIALNKTFKHVYLSVRDNDTAAADAAATAIKLMRKNAGLGELKVWLFDSDSAKVWGESGPKKKAA